ncbi:MAG TPA: TolC family protein [Polyangia bacterium]
MSALARRPPRALLAGVSMVAGLAAGLHARAARAVETLPMEDAVALALRRNRDAIAARLEIDGATLDVVAARLYPNPLLQYSVGNLVLGSANPQGGQVSGAPGFFGQPVQSVAISQLVDVWQKRSARVRAADASLARRRFLTEDVLREIAYGVRTAFATVARKQEEVDLAVEISQRYGETVRLSRSRFAAGDISEADLRKIELEGLKYQNQIVDAQLDLDLARAALAALLALPSARELPARVAIDGGRPAFDFARLAAVAREQRPDLKAVRAGRGAAAAELTAAEREVMPDLTLGAAYTHSAFTVSGDNPNTLALSIGLPLPLFDRNQANIGRARLDQRRADNDEVRVLLEIDRELEEAARRIDRSRQLLAVFEGRPGQGDGLLARAETALRVSERSYKAGATSLLELLDAQRTYLQARGDYLRAVNDFRQAAIDVAHAVGGPVP